MSVDKLDHSTIDGSQVGVDDKLITHKAASALTRFRHGLQEAASSAITLDNDTTLCVCGYVTVYPTRVAITTDVRHQPPYKLSYTDNSEGVSGRGGAELTIVRECPGGGGAELTIVKECLGGEGLN